MGKWKWQGIRTWVAIGSAVLLMMGIAIPAMAANSVSIEVTGEPEAALQTDASAETATSALTWNAYIDDLMLPSVRASRSDQTSSGTLKLTADGSGGGNLGWKVTVQSSAFVYSGTAGGIDIPAANFSITSARPPTRISGNPIDPVFGPRVPIIGATGKLNSPRTVLQASPTFGQGVYAQNLDVSLLIPGGSVAGSYSATLTVTMSPGSL